MALELTPWGYVDRDTPPPFEALSGSISPTYRLPPSPLKPHAGVRTRRKRPQDTEMEMRLESIEAEIRRVDDDAVQLMPGPTASPQIGGV